MAVHPPTEKSSTVFMLFAPSPPQKNSAGAASIGAERVRVNFVVLCALAVLVGVVTSFGAIVLRALIGSVHNAFYNGVLSPLFDANVLEAPSRFGVWT